MKTRAELIARILSNLGVLAAGQAPSAEDRDEIDGLIEPTIAKLAADEVIGGVSGDAVDPAVFLDLSRIIAEEAMPAFGITGSKAEQVAALAMASRQALRLAYRVYEPLRPMRFEPGALQARRSCGWLG